MKTVHQWLNTIQDPEIRKRAKRNARNRWGWAYIFFFIAPELDVEEALLGSFRWDKSPEGYNFWREVASNPYACFENVKHLI